VEDVGRATAVVRAAFPARDGPFGQKWVVSLEALIMKTWFGATLAVAIVVAAGTAADPPPRPDPALVKMYAASESVKGAEEKQAKLEADLIRDLDKFLAAVGPLTPELEKLTVEKTREVAKSLHGMGKRLLAFHKDYEASNAALVGAYAAAPAGFRAAAGMYRGYAAEEPFKDIKLDYARLAEVCNLLAGRYEKRAAALPDEARQIRETMKFVERTVLYLERHDVVAAAAPDLAVGADRTRFLAGLKQYIDGYESFRKNMTKFHEKLTSEPAVRPVGRP
jgi:hypothetical protein